ncbi:hypothetical protein CH302_27495, partial [Rhodococcus sp. 15-2388-1-1a]|uniref:hypothetical protein n=1 Tax=Rhodococcus sp. 15-2388-1-1a TaxID=2023142 RepID=UPI000BC6D918
MADAIVTVDESSTLPESVRTKLEEGLDTRYAPGGNALSVAAFGVDPAQTAGTNTPLFQAAI